MMTGHFATAKQLADEAHSLGQQARDPNVVIITIHRWAHAWVAEQHAELLACDSQVRALLGRVQPDYLFAQQAFMTTSHARAGELAPVSQPLRELRKNSELRGWPHYQYFLAEPCFLLKETEIAHELYDCLLPHAERIYTWGLTGMFVAPPYTQPLGLLAMTVGRFDDAVQHLEDALLRSEAIGLRSHLARLRYQCALALLGRDIGGDEKRARTLLCSARDLATELGQAGLLPLIDEKL
jgi:hypothetical protein